MPEDVNGPTIESVDREIEGGFRFLNFSPQLESLYEHDTRGDRVRYSVYTILLATFLFDLFLLGDCMMMPDMFWPAVVIRFGIATPLLLLTTFVTSRMPPRQVREALVGFTTIVCVIAFMTVLGMSRSPDRVVYQASVILVVVFDTVVLRLRIRYAAATIAGILAAHFTMVMRLSEMTPRLMGFIILFFVVASILLLWAVFVLEKQERRCYLLDLRGRLLTDHLDRIAKQDALTGLGNRRHLETAMISAWTRSQGRPIPMSVILLDIDYFKTFNDSYGHLEGDHCLTRLAASVRAVVGDDANASAVRFGGEEFLIFLEDAGLETATRVAERIRTEIKKAAIPHHVLGDGVTVTASLGVATGQAPLVPMNKLIAAADDALYAAKRAGRDRMSSVNVSHDPESLDPRLSRRSPVQQLCFANAE